MPRLRKIEIGTNALQTYSSIFGKSSAAQCRRRCLLLFVTVVGCSLVWPLPERATAAGDKPTEYDVEAAYLFNFGKFVTWPNTAGTQKLLTICVLGDDPFGPTLDHIVSGEKIDGRTVIDKKLSTADDAPYCSILYISSSEATRLTRILAIVKDTPVLTVSDIPNFTDRGGIIQFVLHENRVRFVVNLGPAQRDGLALSSELLKVALSVKRGEGSQ